MNKFQKWKVQVASSFANIQTNLAYVIDDSFACVALYVLTQLQAGEWQLNDNERSLR